MPNLPVAFLALEHTDLQRSVLALLQMLGAYQIQHVSLANLQHILESAHLSEHPVLFLESSTLEAGHLHLQHLHPALAVFVLQNTPSLPEWVQGFSVFQTSDLLCLQQALQQAAGAAAARTPLSRQSVPQFFDQIPECIYRFRLSPRIGFEYVSKGITAMTGYTPEECYQNPDLNAKLIHPDDRPLLQHVRSHPEEAHHLVLRFMHRDGRVVWIEQHNHPVHEDGVLVAIEGVARDITARIEAEQQEKLLSVAVEQAESAVAITLSNLDGGVAQVLYVNQAFERLLGYRLNEALHHRLKELLNPQFGPETSLRVRDTLLKGESAAGSSFLTGKNGHQMYAGWTITPVRSAAGEISHFVYVFQDHTQQYLHQQLQQAENQILTRLVHNSSLTEALNQLCHQLEGLHHNIRASVLLLEGSGTMQLAASPSFSAAERVLLAEAATHAFEPAVVAAMPGQVRDAHFGQAVALNLPHTPEAGSVFCLPILGQNQGLLGVLSVESQSHHGFPEWLNTAGQRLAAIAAVAIERQQAQQQVFEHARVFQGLFEHARDSIAMVHVEKGGRFTYQQVNSVWLAQTGFQEHQVVGHTARDFFPEGPAQVRESYHRICAATCEAVQFEEILHLGSRTVRWLTQLVPVLDARGEVDLILSSSRDIGLIKHAEQKLLKLNRLYTLLSEINKVMVRARSREELYGQVCQVAVHQGGLRLAWISELDPDGRTLRTAVCSEDSLLPLGTLRIDLSDQTNHQGMSSRAVLQDRAVVVSDTTSSEVTRPWASILQAKGLHSAAAYPLRLHGQVMGCLNFFAEEPDFFEPDIDNLLSELSRDLSFALDHLHGNQLRKQLEEDLAQREARQRSLVQSQSTFLLRTDLRGQFTFVNQAFLKAFGFNEQTFLTFTIYDLLLPAEQQKVIELTQQCLEQPGQPFPITVRLTDPHGELRDLECEFVAVRGATGRPSEIQCVGTDRTEHRKANQARLEAERRLHTSMDHFPGIFAIVDLDFRMLYVNRAGAQMVGAEHPQQLIGKDIWENAGLHADPFAEAFVALIELMEACKTTISVQTREVHSALLKATYQITCVPVHSKEQAFNEILVVVSDLTEERRREAQMRLLSQVVEDSPSMVVVTDPAGQLEYANQRYLNLHGAAETADPQDLNVWQEMWEALKAGQTWQGELQSLQHGGEVQWEKVSAFPIRDGQGEVEHFVRLSEDITHTKTLQARLHYLAYHDPLTGLPNRQLLLDRLGQAIQHAARSGLNLGVVLLDLDQFKIINDTYGHAFGDQMLTLVTERLKGCIRPGDTISRQGGDEFVLLLSELQLSQDAALVASRILDSFRQPFLIEGQEFFITGSMGISVYPQDGSTPEELIQHADTALNRSKQEGRNNYQFFESQMNTLLHERMIIENGIRRGIEREEFFLLYQPRVDLHSGKIREVEALVRWEHPGLGRVSPMRFIPLAEETGAILPLGEAVLKMACQQAQIWQAQGFMLPVSVNISARQFHKQDLTMLVPALLQEYGLPPHLLRLEITESAMIADFQHTIEVLNALRAQGISVEIDDFGTGYSSLSYLHQLPITTLKIDRSFLTGMGASKKQLHDSSKLVEAILSLGKTLDLEVIAEGVETEHQRQFLLQHGCEYAQGYLFSPPVEAEKINLMLENQN
ncbi:EAL domain-containing protein [Deinococcus roseus]|uniref:Diguanylate cyclase n=1 Tax=Deinococcus roseus TaxID=392414 RepID=A0ABQ2D1L4_9DEIO|nr:EAL domain-containing protein [Deinococcus roseus]GGJ39146.1 hypothetical protein GCM10008938_26450 [Deinococcus roseus]